MKKNKHIGSNEEVEEAVTKKIFAFQMESDNVSKSLDSAQK